MLNESNGTVKNHWLERRVDDVSIGIFPTAVDSTVHYKGQLLQLAFFVA